jgi:hypothetical protein
MAAGTKPIEQERATATVVLELNLGAEPMSGSLTEADGPARNFEGWLELVSMLESIRKQVSDQRRDS